MEYREYGNTGVKVSVLGYGCGAVGGLMVRGEHKDMLRTVEYALESGINYFDTARMYGDGLSEVHTGAILRELGADDALVGTKVRLAASEFENIEATIEAQIDNSLKRLGSDSVDIVYTHNSIGSQSDPVNGILRLDFLRLSANVFNRGVDVGMSLFWRFN